MFSKHYFCSINALFLEGKRARTGSKNKKKTCFRIKFCNHAIAYRTTMLWMYNVHCTKYIIKDYFGLLLLSLLFISNFLKPKIIFCIFYQGRITRDERRRLLHAGYGFLCSCHACALPPPQLEEDDRLRQEAWQLSQLSFSYHEDLDFKHLILQVRLRNLPLKSTKNATE
jgi:hypothetical protein